MSSDPHHLNPGSVDAANQGCLCPVADNQRGKGLDGAGGVFWVVKDCPLHGFDNQDGGDDD